MPGSKAAKPSKASIEELMYAKLKTSCLDRSDAKRLGMRAQTPEEMSKHGLPYAVEAFEIPYFTLEGKADKGFSRWRYLGDTRTGFELMTTKKPVRYVQRKDSPARAYFPPLLQDGATWADVAADPDTDLVITEGELKAACATKHGHPTVGLGGVWSFRATKSMQTWIPDLEKIEWAGRKVTVCYDSDAVSNPDVQGAIRFLAIELVARGSQVHVAKIPSAAGAKQGIDDLILAKGADAFAKVLEEAEEFEQSVALHALNEEVVYIKHPSMVVVYETGKKMPPGDFANEVYANRTYNEWSYDSNGNRKSKKVQSAPAWMKWEHRFELEQMEFKPGEGKVTEAGGYNTWPGWGVEPKRGDVSRWKRLLDHLFAGKPEDRDWFERWLAYPLQHPGSKMYTTAVVWGGATGTGKSLVGYSMKRIYGETFAEIGDVQLNDPRMAWAENKCFAMGDDVASHEQRRMADQLKRMITQESITIDIKYIPQYSVPDVINYYFTSNHADAFYLEDDDRRFFVHEVTVEPMEADWYREYAEWLDSGGAAAIFHHLLSLDLKGMTNAERAKVTDAKKAMLEDGLSDLGQWVRRLRDDPNAVLKFGAVPIQGDLWQAGDIARLYDPEGRKAGPAAVAREMKRAGIKMAYKGMPVRTGSGQFRLFAPRNGDKWFSASAKEIGKHYDETRGQAMHPRLKAVK